MRTLRARPCLSWLCSALLPLFAVAAASCGGQGEATRTWSLPELVPVAQGASAVVVAGNRHGALACLWWRYVLSANELWINRFDPTTGWQPGERLATDITGTYQWGPRVLVDHQGAAVAVWLERRARRWFVTAWRAAPGRLGEEFRSDADWEIRPDVAVNSLGDAAAVWAVDGQAWAVTYLSGAGGWQAPVRLSAPEADSIRSPRVVLDAFGGGWAVWAEHTAVWTLRARRLGLAGDWGPATTLGVPNSRSITVDDVAAGSGGEFMVVASIDAAGRPTHVWRFVPGAGWDAGHWLGRPAAAVRIVARPDGEALVVWHYYPVDMFFTHFTPTRGWSAPELFLSPPLEPDFDLAATPSGDVFFAWGDEQGFVRTVWVRRFSAQAGWSEPTQLAAALPACYARIARYSGDSRPQLVVDGAGNVTAFWYHTECDRTSTMWSSHYSAR